jgi:hypothetical protein
MIWGLIPDVGAGFNCRDNLRVLLWGVRGAGVPRGPDGTGPSNS